MYFDKLLYLFLFRNRETNYHVWHKEYMYIYIYTTYTYILHTYILHIVYNIL